MRKSTNFIVGSTLVILSLGICFSASYYLTNYLFNQFGQPKSFVAFLFTSFLGFLIFGMGVNIARFIFLKFHKHEPPHSQLLDAMTKMSQGNFDVFVKPDIRDEHDILNSLASGINQMAQSLGSMENLRQDFISNVSHEIQSPLTSISGFAALLKNDSLPPEKRAHYIDVIETESKRLSKLSDNLLKLSSLESNVHPLSQQTFQLNQQIENTVLMLEPQWMKKELELSLSLERTTISGDDGLLSQLWINLLHNAIKFTPEHGQIKISLSNNQQEAICQIVDTGIGISPEDQLHIFERFYKADRSRDRSIGGNGLGLSLVRKIINLHGGKIDMKSELGEGTNFTVTLPLRCLESIHQADETA